MSSTCMCLNTEIQDLKPAELHTLGIILNYSDSWKKLMAIVPTEENGLKFNTQHISIVEQAAETDDRNAAEIFIEEWSSMGRKAPTLGLLLDLLIKAELYRAADYIACNILKQEKPKRPDNGPAATININNSFIEKLLEEQQITNKQNTSTNSLMLESTSKLVFNQEMCPCDKADNNTNKSGNINLPDITDNFLNCEKTTNDVSFKIVSDLMKFSTTDVCEAVNDHMQHTFASISKSNSTEIEKKVHSPIVQQSPAVATYYYEYKEVSSQELPVFLNNSKQSALSSETFNSSNIPLCLKDLSL